MYINEPSATKIEAADRVNLLIVLAASLNNKNLENLVKCWYPCTDMRHFMTVTKKLKKTLAFRHRNYTLDNFIKPRSILKQLCMWLVEVVNANKHLPVSKKFCFKYRMSMI